jgi:hypothetical protein
VGCSPSLTPVPTHWDRWCKLTRAFVERPQRARFKPLREGQLLRSAMNVAKWRFFLVPIEGSYGRKPPLATFPCRENSERSFFAVSTQLFTTAWR